MLYECNEEVLMRMRLKKKYPIHKAIWRESEPGKYFKSGENDVIYTPDYILLNRSIYIDRDTMTIGQLRTVLNRTNGYNPYGDRLLEVGMCMKPNVVKAFPNQREVIQKTIDEGRLIYHQIDTFHEDSYPYGPPTVEIYQARIVSLVDTKMILECL